MNWWPSPNRAYLLRAFGTSPKFALRANFRYAQPTSGCVKTHVCIKNKPYTTFKLKNKVKKSQNLGF